MISIFRLPKWFDTAASRWTRRGSIGCDSPPIDRIICSAVFATVGETFPRRAFTCSV